MKYHRPYNFVFLLSSAAILVSQSSIAIDNDSDEAQVRQECRHELTAHNSVRYLGLAMEYEDCEELFADAIDEHHNDYVSTPKTDHPEHCRILSTYVIVGAQCNPDNEFCPEIF